MACKMLRIDPGDSSPVLDYRIENGHVESRAAGAGEAEEQWRELTPEQLCSHVMADTVLAHWLRRRMGIFPLIRACTPEYSSTNSYVPDRERRRAA